MASNILIGYIERRNIYKQLETIPHGVVRPAELNKISSHFNPENVIIATGNIYEGSEAIY